MTTFCNKCFPLTVALTCVLLINSQVNANEILRKNIVALLNANFPLDTFHAKFECLVKPLIENPDPKIPVEGLTRNSAEKLYLIHKLFTQKSLTCSDTNIDKMSQSQDILLSLHRFLYDIAKQYFSDKFLAEFSLKCIQELNAQVVTHFEDSPKFNALKPGYIEEALAFVTRLGECVDWTTDFSRLVDFSLRVKCKKESSDEEDSNLLAEVRKREKLLLVVCPAIVEPKNKELQIIRACVDFFLAPNSLGTVTTVEYLKQQTTSKTNRPNLMQFYLLHSACNLRGV